MASGTGYIYDWIVNDVGGIIHVCDGDHLVGDDVAFPFDECRNDLQKILKKKGISDDVDCPPPTGALRVKFDFDIFDGEDLAVNVSLN
ncbi:MAG: hypothetical protein ACRD9S_14790 [Pyrinomonadaceae bacterium]